MFASNYGEQVAGPLLKEYGHSQVLLEQYLDFIVNRTFRQTLLVHEDRAGGIRYRLEPERLHEMHFASYLPCSDGESRLDTSRQTYGTGGAAITTERPEVKAALDVLTAAWPDTISHEDLLEHITERTASADRREQTSKLDELLEILVIKDQNPPVAGVHGPWDRSGQRRRDDPKSCRTLARGGSRDDVQCMA